MNLLAVIMKVSWVRGPTRMIACLRVRGGRVRGMDGEGGERHWYLAILYVNNFLISRLVFYVLRIKLGRKQDVE